jgi:hypothetical protein
LALDVHIYTGENEECEIPDATEEDGDLPTPDPELISKYILQPDENELAGQGFSEIGPDGEPTDDTDDEDSLDDLEFPDLSLENEDEETVEVEADPTEAE